MTNYSEIISKELQISYRQVEKTLELLGGGATVAFIARYRKEMTGSLDETEIIAIRDRLAKLIELDKRRETIITTISEQGKLTKELEQQIMSAPTIAELEDIYLPYRPKRKTRASAAIEKGLEPLAKIIVAQNRVDLEGEAEKAANGKMTIEEALAGARDIIAEWVNENKASRSKIRFLFSREAAIKSKVAKGKDKEGDKFNMYFDFEEKLFRAQSYRVLAMFRGENEGFLKINILPDEDRAIDILENLFIKGNNDCSKQVQLAIKDSYKRLLSPSIETEVRNELKEKADIEAIKVFAENLRQLLLAPPLGQKNILALDPGFRTGCKLVCLDKQGNLLHNETIYPHPPQNERKQAEAKIQSLINAYKIEAIAIGNGTAGRETESFIKNIKFYKDIIALMVNENGASIYSVSDVARQEFPDYDVTVRGAVSIGRRLMDPLAELVKLDPKSVGVGQYQHDVDQILLQKSLDDVVVSCVNSVGVELNTASKQLLKYVSGVGEALAENIVEYRKENGDFKSRKELKKVKRFGEKAFEQAAGFLRINNAKNYLDRSAVHPESYHIVDKMAKDLNTNVEKLISDAQLRSRINLKNYISETVGMPTLEDIIKELAKPGRDPRKTFEIFEFNDDIHSITDLREGMIVNGIVTNLTDFGAFVDIGVHQDGLLHRSEIAERYIASPADVLSLNQKLKVKVLKVEVERKRINLSLKGL